MTYNITLTNGQTLVNIADGTADTSYSSLTLFGKNYAGYGPLMDENFVKLLENFSNVTPPVNPLQGQLWWDSNSKLLKVHKDASWKVVGGSTSASTPPATDIVGDFWWDSANSQLNVFNGTGWSIIGPAFTAGQGVSGPVVSTIPGAIDGLYHNIVEFYCSGTPVAVLSKDAAFTVNVLPGFSTIRPGFNLPDVGYQYYGDANNSLSLGNVLAANYLRGDVDSTTFHAFNVRTNDGITLGLNNDLTVGVAGGAVNFIGNTADRHMDFFVSKQGVSTLALHVNAQSGLVSVAADPTTDMGIATKQYVDNSIVEAGTHWIKRDGSSTIEGNLITATTNVYNLGAPGNQFATVYANSFTGSTATIATGTFNEVLVNHSPANSNSATTKDYVDTANSNLVAEMAQADQIVINALTGSAPSTLNSFEKVANALNGDASFGTTVNGRLALLAALASPSFSGNPQAPTAPVSDVSSSIATTSFVSRAVANQASAFNSALVGYAPLASPAFTGNPTALTQAISDSSTKLATTAYVTTKVANAVAGLNASNPTFTGTANFDSVQCSGLGVNAVGITTTTNNSLDIGTANNRFRKIYGTAMTANYADLAENYTADAAYEPGTVLDFGGDAEVTISDGAKLTRLAGVVSTNPAYLMNDGCAGTHVVALALQGRCPVKVTGPVRKGDLLVSAGNGRARACLFPNAGTIIGKAIAENDDGEGIIEVSVGRC